MFLSFFFFSFFFFLFVFDFVSIFLCESWKRTIVVIICLLNVAYPSLLGI